MATTTIFIISLIIGLAVLAIALSLIELWDDSEDSEDNELYFFPIDEDGRV